MKYVLFVLSVVILSTAPVCAQLSRPLTGQLAPNAITFFRVAIISKQSFVTEDAAKAAMVIVLDKSDFYKPKVVKEGNKYRIAMMVRIIFFERKEADAACEFLKKQQGVENHSDYDIQVISDNSY